MSEFNFKTVKRKPFDTEILYTSVLDFLPEFGIKASFDNWIVNAITILGLKNNLDYFSVMEEENNGDGQYKKVTYISKDIAIKVCKLCESEKRNQIISYLERLS